MMLDGNKNFTVPQVLLQPGTIPYNVAFFPFFCAAFLSSTSLNVEGLFLMHVPVSLSCDTLFAVAQPASHC